MLLVSYAEVTPEMNAYVTQEAFEKSGLTIEEIEAEALNRWVAANQEPAWEGVAIPHSDQEVMTIRGESDIIGTMLLSGGHLKGMHQHFGEEILAVIIPDRFTICVHPDMMAMPGLAQSMYDDACQNGTQLSPTTFVSNQGEVVGYCEPQVAEGQVAAAEEPTPVQTAADVIGVAFLMVGSVTAQVESGLDPVLLMMEVAGGMQVLEADCEAAEVDGLRKVIKEIVTNVAFASGGALFGLGSKISKEEKTVLEMLDGLMDS